MQFFIGWDWPDFIDSWGSDTPLREGISREALICEPRTEVRREQHLFFGANKYPQNYVPPDKKQLNSESLILVRKPILSFVEVFHHEFGDTP